MGCLSGIAKYLLFLLNFLIVLCGILLIAFGAIILINEDKGVEAFTDFSVGGFAIAVGVIIFLIAFFGCCGAIKENKCMLTTYAVILITLLILQVVLGAMAFVAVKNDDGEIDEKINKAVKKLFDKYGSNSDDKKLVDNLQEDLECCGVVDYNYWNGNIPDSCCSNSPCTSQNVYKTGCGEAFKDLISSNIEIIGGVAIGFAVIELVGAIFACMVRNR